MKRIIWLASYPKSGNTWFRAFLSNLRRETESAAHINALDYTPIASARALFDDAVGYDSGLLSHAEIDRLRPETYLQYAAKAKKVRFQKIHDAYTWLADGRLLFPSEVTFGAIYLIRNPLDVCVSFAHHSAQQDIDKIIHNMGDSHFAFCNQRAGQDNQLRQRLLSWRGHVRSWTEASAIQVHILRYEDMKLNPQKTFTQAADFANFPSEPERIAAAIEASSFDKLKSQEAEDGFQEKMPRAKSFFRKGEIGSWREQLTGKQVDRLIADHRDMMVCFGYLNSVGQPVF